MPVSFGLVGLASLPSPLVSGPVIFSPRNESVSVPPVAQKVCAPALPGAMIQPVTSMETCPAPPLPPSTGPVPCPQPANSASASVAPVTGSRLNWTQPQKPPSSPPQKSALLQFSDSPTCQTSRVPTLP